MFNKLVSGFIALNSFLLGVFLTISRIQGTRVPDGFQSSCESNLLITDSALIFTPTNYSVSILLRVKPADNLLYFELEPGDPVPFQSSCESSLLITSRGIQGGGVQCMFQSSCESSLLITCYHQQNENMAARFNPLASQAC